MGLSESERAVFFFTVEAPTILNIKQAALAPCPSFLTPLCWPGERKGGRAFSSLFLEVQWCWDADLSLHFLSGLEWNMKMWGPHLTRKGPVCFPQPHVLLCSKTEKFLEQLGGAVRFFFARRTMAHRVLSPTSVRAVCTLAVTCASSLVRFPPKVSVIDGSAAPSGM